MEWYWPGKSELLRGKPVLVPLFPPQALYGLPWERAQASAFRRWRQLDRSTVRPALLTHTNWSTSIRYGLCCSETDEATDIVSCNLNRHNDFCATHWAGKLWMSLSIFMSKSSSSGDNRIRRFLACDCYSCSQFMIYGVSYASHWLWSIVKWYPLSQTLVVIGTLFYCYWKI
jgi:hypothetical protein